MYKPRETYSSVRGVSLQGLDRVQTPSDACTDTHIDEIFSDATAVFGMCAPLPSYLGEKRLGMLSQGCSSYIRRRPIKEQMGCGDDLAFVEADICTWGTPSA